MEMAHEEQRYHDLWCRGEQEKARQEEKARQQRFRADSFYDGSDGFNGDYYGDDNGGFCDQDGVTGEEDAEEDWEDLEEFTRLRELRTFVQNGEEGDEVQQGTGMEDTDAPTVTVRQPRDQSDEM
jgi:hypothetical protein